MSQTKLGSFAEAWFNVAVGFGINFLGNIYILPMWGLHPSVNDALMIGVVFTVISVARSYILRRFMNRWKARWNVAAT
jgi:hypothetical protein